MAIRRMFSKNVVRTDVFLDMPDSTQLLYFHLGVEADDDGFVNPKVVMRTIGSQDDNLKLLIAKKFLIQFEDGVIVITHWKMNNDIRQDRYHETQYLIHKSRIGLNNNIYMLGSTTGSTSGIPRLGKVRLEIPRNTEENTEAPKVASYTSEEDPEDRVEQPCDEEGNPIVVKQPKKKSGALTTTEIAARAAAIRQKKLHPVFNFTNELLKLKDSKYKPDKIVALVWHRKGLVFDNWEQFNANLARDRKLAQALTGYSGQEVGMTIDVCERDSEKNNYEWGVATISKKIANLVNKTKNA